MRLLILLLLTLRIFPASAAPRAEPWRLWEAHDDANQRTIDQAPWARFLRQYVRTAGDGINRVDYAAVGAADRTALEQDLVRLTGLPVSTYARAEQRAFWTNLYNELTVAVVLRHWPVSSILKIGISPGLFSFGPWDAKLIAVEGTTLSLNDIENRILRPIWHDPRTHYSINCASLGCPNLAPEPYSAADMEAMLDNAARAYINHPRGATVTRGRLTVSRIYDWFQSDFGGTEQGVIAHLRQYADPRLAAALAGIDSIHSYQYDWDVNAP